MTDRYDENLILGYVEGDLSDAERARFEATLAGDPALRALVADLVRDRDDLRTLPRERPPEGLLDDALGQLERGMLLGEGDTAVLAGPAVHHRFRVWRVLGYSGMAALILISGGVLLHTLTDVDLLDTAGEYAEVGEWLERDEQQLAALTQDGAPPPARSAAEPTADAPPLAPRSADDLGADEAAERLGESIALAPAQPAPAAPQAPKDARAGSSGPETKRPELGVAEAHPPHRDAGAQAAATPAMELAEAQDAEADAAGDVGLDPVARLAQQAHLSPPLQGSRLAMLDAEATPLPPVKIRVVTPEPERAKRDVLAWATSNNLAVAGESPAARVGEASPRSGTPSDDAQPIVVEVPSAQVPELVAYLNRTPRQRAGVVHESAVLRRIEPAEAAPREGSDADAAAPTAEPESFADLLRQQLGQAQATREESAREARQNEVTFKTPGGAVELNAQRQREPQAPPPYLARDRTPEHAPTPGEASPWLPAFGWLPTVPSDDVATVPVYIEVATGGAEEPADAADPQQPERP